MHDCIGILYSDSEFMDLRGSLILAPPGVFEVCLRVPRHAPPRRRHAWGAGLLASSSWRWQHCSDDRRFQGHKWSRRVRQLPLSSSLQRTDCIYVAEQARKFYSCASSCCSGCADFEKPSPSCLLRLRRTASLEFGHELKCTTLIGA